MTSFSPIAATAQTTEPRDCLKLRMENGWSRAEFRQCKLEESRKRTAQLDAEFAEIRAWLQAPGLDVNDAGHITDPKGRTLAQIEASNAALAAGNAALAAGNADLAAGNAALRADIRQLELRIKTANAEYQRILKEFERAVLQGN